MEKQIYTKLLATPIAPAPKKIENLDQGSNQQTSDCSVN